MRPGVDVISRALPPPLSAPTDTSVAFVIGPTAAGVTPVPPDVALVHSMTEYVAVFGDRTGGEVTYDAADVYFREGGSRLYVSRTNSGTTTLAASLPDDLDSRTRGELDVIAHDFGVDPSQYQTKADLLAALQDAAATPLVTDTGVAAALAALNADLGPGQIFIADPTLAAVVDNQSALLAHCEANNRVALLSAADGDAASLIAAGTALQNTANGRYGALFAPSAIVPGVVAGTTRTVPYAAVEAGIIARNDAAYGPNQAAAGVLGQTLFATDLYVDTGGRYTDLDYQNLNEASVDMARIIYGGVRTYGYRALVDDATPEWLSFGYARLNMAITADAGAIGESYLFAQLDGNGHTIAQFGGELSAMLLTYYNQGALYGATPEDAFQVDVGSSVNTPETIANGELHAVISVRMSPFSEWVVIEIVKVDTTQTLPATALAVAA